MPLRAARHSPQWRKPVNLRGPRGGLKCVERSVYARRGHPRYRNSHTWLARASSPRRHRKPIARRKGQVNLSALQVGRAIRQYHRQPRVVSPRKTAVSTDFDAVVWGDKGSLSGQDETARSSCIDDLRWSDCRCAWLHRPFLPRRPVVGSAGPGLGAPNEVISR